MRRSEINWLVRRAKDAFTGAQWTLPPNPRWDVTDFGLGDWRSFGLVLVNLAEEPEYCEKLMYAQQGMVTPAHTHRQKKEDIIARKGKLRVQLWSGYPTHSEETVAVKLNGNVKTLASGSCLDLLEGYRVTLTPGIYHAFWPITEECIIGEVSTANDDLYDNIFVDSEVGRFTQIEEDEPPIVNLVSDSKTSH
jgi:D-lyxose ketol-isomerase